MTPDKYCRQVKVSSFFFLYISKQTMVPRNNGCCFRLEAIARLRDKQESASTLLSTHTRAHRHACVIPITKAIKLGRQKAGKKGQTVRLLWHLRHTHTHKLTLDIDRNYFKKMKMWQQPVCVWGVVCVFTCACVLVKNCVANDTFSRCIIL